MTAPGTIQRILLSRMKFIGDVVLTTPVIRAVRERYPSAFIAYLGERGAVSLLHNNPFLDEIIPYDFSRNSVLEQIRVIARLRRLKLDVFVDLFSNPRSAVLARASGARIRIGKDVRGRGRFFTHRIGDYGSLKSAIEFHYQYVKPIGVDMTGFRTEIFLTEEEKREARIYLTLQDIDPTKPVVALHPGATWPNKMWPKERFAELIDLLRAKLGVEILLSPGPGDDALMEAITSLSAAPVHVLPVLPVRQLAGIFSQCSLLVANDCGPMHIGVAVATPTIGIFGPEPPEVWFPYSEEAGHKALFRKIECSPCRTTACFRGPAHFMECMDLIPAREVLEEVRKSIKTPPPSPPSAAFAPPA